MTPKPACTDFTFPLLAHDQVLQLISMLAFERVDIGLFEERSHLWPSREFATVIVFIQQACHSEAIGRRISL